MSTILHKNTLGLLIASLLATTGLAHAADTAQINITATVEDNTCTLESSSKAQSVDLGHVSRDKLVAGTTPEKTFSLKLTGCSDSASTVVVTSPSEAVDETDLFKMGGDAEGVGVKIVGGDDKKTLTPMNGEGVIYALDPNEGGSKDLDFTAQLVKTGTEDDIKSGSVTGAVTLNLEYQ